MKQVININYHGRIIPIEVTAYELLKSYTHNLQVHFEKENGKEEIINDIENRISELFQEQLNKGAICITDDDVNAVIRSIGKPEDFDTDFNHTKLESESESHISHNPKRLYRDENNKFIGGVCSGLANYFQIDKSIVRIIFLILFFSFGVGLIPYLILWIAVPSSANHELGAVKKKLYRDADDKLIAGVCSGLAHYFGIKVWIPRVLFLLPLLSMIFEWNHLMFNVSPSSILIYIILWLVLPEAKTTSEKLEMKGEKVDMNSIQNAINNEMKGVKDRAQKLGAEAGKKITQMQAESSVSIKKIFQVMVKILAFIVKSFIYFILAVIGLALLATLFGLGVGAFAVFPFKDYLLSGTSENLYACGVLVFLFLIPIIGMLTWIIRKIAGIKKQNKLLGISVLVFFIVGLVSLFALLTTLSKDFSKKAATAEQFIQLQNPDAQKLEVNFFKKTTYELEGENIDYLELINMLGDSIYVENVSLQIEKSPSDRFMFSIQKFANGKTNNEAIKTSEKINYELLQKDSVLLLNQLFYFNKKDKFRNQRIKLKIYIPKGKRIKFNGGGLKKGNIIYFSPFSVEIKKDNDDKWENDDEYIMDENGFHPINKEIENFETPTLHNNI
jgi:phage shock protein PspC (stress-responsive transcriptional regulator)/vacuolar-type H+-ATPase subunit H